MLNPNSKLFAPGYGFAGFLIGVALAGFLGGILLHQILQWHSLLSSLDGQVYQDLRFRMLTDGIFHAAMYGIVLVGLWLLWRARHQLAAAGSGRRFASTLFIGFGVWHLTDALLNHWILGLHHIKEGSPNWLVWDLTFFVLGVVCICVGVLLRRSGGPNNSRLNEKIASAVAVVAVAAGAIAASPWSNSPVTVVFKKGIEPTDVLSALASVNARILWSNPEGDIWTVALESKFAGWSFYRRGAVYVSGSFLGIGCFSGIPVPSV